MMQINKEQLIFFLDEFIGHKPISSPNDASDWVDTPASPTIRAFLIGAIGKIPDSSWGAIGSKNEGDLKIAANLAEFFRTVATLIDPTTRGG